MAGDDLAAALEEAKRDAAQRVPARMYDVAVELARAGLRVFPVDMRPGPDGKRSKRPLPGYRWKDRASSAVNHVVEDFLDAEERLAPEDIGVAWALGLDGYLAVDVDVDDPPAFMSELELERAAVNVTMRGCHYLYRMPAGRVTGNGIGRFPKPDGWGEVRGAGGYIVVAGADRPGFELAELERVFPFPRPEWLTDAGPEVGVVTDAELSAFLDRHTEALRPRHVEGYRSELEAWKPGVSRHMTAVTVACWMARESAAGLVSAGVAFAVLREWWRSVAEVPHLEVRRWWDRELGSILRFAVGVAGVELERVASLRAEALAEDIARNEYEDLATRILGAPPAPSSPGSSFDPVDLEPYLGGDAELVRADLLELDGGRAILHRARLNGIHGDSGAGKSWLVALVVRDELDAGHGVVVVDLEDTPAPLIARLRQIGVADEAIRRGLVFLHPDEAFTPGNVERLVSIVRTRRARHVLLDSLGEAFALEGIDENADAEVAPWLTRVIRHIIDTTGAGVTLIDHITKAGDNPLHPSGSKRKRAAVTGTSWLVVALEPFTLAEGGRIALRCGKDRHGEYRRGDTVAHLVMSPPDVSTGRTVLELVAPPAEESEEGGGRRDPLDVVADVLELRGELDTQSVIFELTRLGMSREAARITLRGAVSRHLVDKRQGTGHQTLYRRSADPPGFAGESPIKVEP